MSTSESRATSWRRRKSLGFGVRAAGLLVIVFAGCTPTVYKSDVEKFSSDIGSATSLFNQLIDNNISRDSADRNSLLVAGNQRLALNNACVDIERYIEDQSECLRDWSLYRQYQSVPKPTCSESDAFSPLPDALKKCEIGFMQNSTLVEAPAVTVADSQNHRRLADALARYATQLGAIVSAQDREDLDGATAEATVAAQSLRDKLLAANPSADPPPDLGPIASFFGTGLRIALEARRFNLLKDVAVRADPIVADVSGRLSTYANQLYYINELEAAFKAADAAALRAVPEPSSTFPARVEEATRLHRVYMTKLSVTPGEVFKAVAHAHHALVAALKNPTRQYIALKQSVTELAEKAKALKDALEAPD